MKKIISFIGMFAVLGVVTDDAHGVAMNAQIKRLLQEKQDKVAQLEACEGKKQGWMIAGISTIGLTAVGIGVNIAQASKSRNLSNEIDASKEELARREADLNRINDEISDLRAKKNAEGKCCGKKNPERCCDCRDQRDGDCPGNDEEHDYSKDDKTCPDITYAWPVVGEPYASKISAKLEEYKMKCEEQQGGSFEFVQATTGTGEIAIGGGKAVCKNRTTCDSNEETEVNIDVEQEVKPCRTLYNEKPTSDCPCDETKGLMLGTIGTCVCGKSGETWNGSKCVKETTKDRVLGQSCWKSDLPADATNGIYWEKPGQYTCRYNNDLVSCSCKVQKCKGDLVVDKNHEKCVKKNLVTECQEGYVRIGGKGDCVKRDYLYTDSCECAKDNSKMCKLDTDHGGDLVCQLAKGIGKKCKCEDCPKGMHVSDELGHCVDDCASNEHEYAGVCLSQSQFAEIKTNSRYGVYCIRSYNTYPGGFPDNTACAKICRSFGGEVVNIVNGSLQQAAYSGCDCSSGGQGCSKVFRAKLPQDFNDRW